MVKFDRFTKTLLVIIAIFLGIIALRPVFHAEVVQANTGQLDNVDFEIISLGTTVLGAFFDRNSGHVWFYDLSDGKVASSAQIQTFGKPMQKN